MITTHQNLNIEIRIHPKMKIHGLMQNHTKISINYSLNPRISIFALPFIPARIFINPHKSPIIPSNKVYSCTWCFLMLTGFKLFLVISLNFPRFKMQSLWHRCPARATASKYIGNNNWNNKKFLGAINEFSILRTEKIFSCILKLKTVNLDEHF